MSVPRQLEDANNQESEQNNTSEDELTGTFQLTKGELEVLLIQTVEQSIGPVMERLVRQIVKEKLEFFKENLMTSIKCKCEKQLGTSESQSLQLKFLDKISNPVFTGEKIEGEGCTSIRVALVDSLTGEVVKSGREATANVELMVLEGDSSGDGGDNWTVEDFDNKIVRAKKGKKALLKGNTCLNLKEGISNISDISFIHNSGWMKRCKLHLGARVVDDFPGTTIKATKTESFTLKDRRNKLYVKNHRPSLSDEVWRLKKIGRKGAFRERLSGENITTVKDFLKILVLNPQRLKKILGVGAKRWEVIMDHAMTCDAVHLYYYPNSHQKTGVVFNVRGQVKGLVKESQYVLIDKLSEKEKENAQQWVIGAFEHWNKVISFDDEKCLKESLSHFSESPRLESGNGCSCKPPSMMNTQPGTESSHGIIPSINCIRESNRLNGSHPGNDDFMAEFLNSCPESQADQRSGVGGFLYAHSAAPVAIVKAHRRWTILFSVLRWFSIRIVARKSTLEKHIYSGPSLPKQWEEVVSFDDDTSPVDEFSLLSNVLCPSNSPMAGCSESINILTLANDVGFDYPQPSAFTPDVYSLGCASSMDDYSSSFPNHAANSLICDTESIAQALLEDEHLQYLDTDCSLQNSCPELQADQRSGLDGFLYAHSAAAGAIVKAHRRWTILFSVLRWFSIRRIVARKSTLEKHIYSERSPHKQV